MTVKLKCPIRWNVCCFHVFFLLFFNPFLDLFYLRDLARCLHHTVHHQCRGYHHAVIGDGLDVLDLDHLGLDTQFLDRRFCPILELIALRSTHPQDFNLFHQSLPPSLSDNPAVRHPRYGRKNDDNAAKGYGLFYAHDRPNHHHIGEGEGWPG